MGNRVLEDGGITGVPNGWLDELAPGVFGYTMEDEHALWIPIIQAERPGSGAVSRYLDSLPLDRTVRVPNVISGRLEGMLERRGFVPRRVWAEEVEQWVQVMERAATIP